MALVEVRTEPLSEPVRSDLARQISAAIATALNAPLEGVTVCVIDDERAYWFVGGHTRSSALDCWRKSSTPEGSTA